MTSVEIAVPTQAAADPNLQLERRVIGKIYRRVILFITLCFFVANVDRINIAFAATELQANFGFSPTVYGLGASAFFVTYVTLTAPSALLLRRAGPRLWLVRILVLWGLVSASMALIQGERSFIAVRLLLGAAEAGFYPFVMAYVSGWLPRSHRARMTSMFVIGVPLAGALAGPISGALLDHMDGVAGLLGWQWMFVLEALPAILCGLVGWKFLPDSPAEARWLDARERAWLEKGISEDTRTDGAAQGGRSLLSVCGNPRLLALGFCYALASFGVYGTSFFLPQIIAELGVRSHTSIGLIVTVPMLIGMVSMILVSRRADREGTPRVHAICALLASGAGFCLAGVSSGLPILVIAGICLSSAGLWAAAPLILSMPLALLTGAAVGGGIGVLNAIGNLGPLAGPIVVGVLRDKTGGYTWSLMVLAGVTVGAALVLFLIGDLNSTAKRPSDDLNR